MQFYFRQFAADEQVMTMDLDSVGAHILLMCAAGASQEGWRLSGDERAIKNLLRNPENLAWIRIKKQLLSGPWKVAKDGFWEQEGMRRVLIKQKEFSKTQSKNGIKGNEKRWGRQSFANGIAK
mgnify:CR=1 FL=1